MKSLVLAATLALAGAAIAQNMSDMADGEVRKVDKGAAKVTIKHGEIKNLEMPPMTMVFQVKDAALLDKLKAGDKVKFRAEKAASGYVVTAIEAAP
jgi:Cu(I)/Ag(I) efflux system periplasmic protein CusF